MLYGHNGAGKTNVLEALYLLNTLRSFRCSELTPLLRYGHPEAMIRALGVDQELAIPSQLQIQLKQNQQSVRKFTWANGKMVRSGIDFYGRLPAILFTPEDLGILRGSPGERRRFFDRILFARERAHIDDIREYEKLLRARNLILRSPTPSLSSTNHTLLSTYETKLAEVGARIWNRREQVLVTLKDDFVATFRQIQGVETKMLVEMYYHSKLGKIAIEQRQKCLFEELREQRNRDFSRGTTSVGPHRDDFIITLNDQQTHSFASQGQMRALILALKIAELKSTRMLTGKAPILLLDDVSSELDPQRSDQLFATLQQVVSQCILTTTAAHFVRLLPSFECQYLQVQDGVISAGEMAI